MRINIALKDDSAWVRVLIKHPMETGLRKDKATGKVIPAHFIKNVTIEHNGQVAVNAKCGVAVSKDPFFFFKVKGTAAGDTIKITWEDNTGKAETAEEKVA
jgi:sulfur-oxidizing protein SoxZ